MLTLANTLTADMGLIPGLAFAGPAVGLPLSVLAAFVERPFYTLAGVRRDTIWYSLQANLVSLGVGFLATFAAMFPMQLMQQREPLVHVWPFVAVCVSISVERRYLQRRLRPDPVNWPWVAAGNVLSAALCVGVLFLIAHLRSTHPELRRALTPYAGPLHFLALLGSIALFVASFSVPQKSPPANTDDGHRPAET